MVKNHANKKRVLTRLLSADDMLESEPLSPGMDGLRVPSWTSLPFDHMTCRSRNGGEGKVVTGDVAAFLMKGFSLLFGFEMLNGLAAATAS
jgi:hypothetical protein